MIKKLLIANRGEIACRIIRTCKQLGITSVAVYSEADQQSLHVSLADEAYLLGPAPASESYLKGEKIIEIAKQTKIDAIHPGYGFLSENSHFAKQCEDEGIIFIGPSSQVIANVSDKATARTFMERANIPVIPGTNTSITTLDKAYSIAKDIGYPIMIKAVAGGGGMGMEVIHSEDELSEKFSMQSERAERLFGNHAMMIERKLPNVRHIEIQILADHYGNIVHLYDRECSIQRRNQKVVEEAPSAFISDTTREKMGEVAVRASKQLSYTGAGTVEFLVDEQENFYFLEMNPRIQVEHPVTEEITGVDLIEQQIHIANGNKLTFKQSDLAITGHSIEMRIYAEDPKTFFPSPGKITNIHLPEGKNIRHERSINWSDYITHYYDPLVSKLIVSGADRSDAIYQLQEALDTYQIEGIQTNLPLLRLIAQCNAFMKGDTTTDFIEKYIRRNL